MLLIHGISFAHLSFLGLYLVAEECREHNAGSYDEQDSPDYQHDFFLHALFARVHLYIDLQAGYDRHYSGDGIAEVNDIEKHGDYEVVSFGKAVGTPTVIDTAALGIHYLAATAESQGKKGYSCSVKMLHVSA